MVGLRRLFADRRQVFAFLLLCWERLWPAIGWGLGLAALFALLAAFDLLPLLGSALHLAVLIAFGLSLAAITFDGVRRFRRPERGEILRRLELDSGLAHRPLQALQDRQAIAVSDPLTEAIWALHRQSMAKAAARIGWARPRDVLLDGDPYGIRAILVLILFIGMTVAGGDLWPRFVRALTPELGQSASVASGYDLWITPPDYTGLPPLYIGSDRKAAESGALPVPVGSTLLAQVHGGGDVPALALDGRATTFAPPEQSGNAAPQYSLTVKLTNEHQLTVSQGHHTLLDRALNPIPDQPPSASWGEPPRITPKGAMRLSYIAKDDYGVNSLTLRVSLVDGAEPPFEIKLPSPQRAKDLKGSVYQDLTGHPWAGSPVDLTIIAQDAVGQTGATEKLRLKLPERIFTNPVAKEIIAQRRMLLADPATEPLVAENLTAIAENPGRFGEDLRVFLGLRQTTMRLGFDRKFEEQQSAAALLWDLALRVEDGQTPEAQKALREAQQALRDALDRNAPNAEIEALSRELQQAIARYLTAMLAQAGKNGQVAQQGQTAGTGVTAEDIAKMLDQARNLATTGARDAAKDALARLQDLLESLKMGGQGQWTAADRQALQALQNLSHQQQQILDRSFQAARGPGGKPGGQTGDGDPGNLATAQDALRRQLDSSMQLLGQMGPVPQSVGRAARSMQSASEALRQAQPGQALNDQSEVIRQLQQAERELAQRMRDQEGEGGAGQADSDPLGRAGTSGLENGDVKLPTATETQRSREILNELRKRASERERPKGERDYIDRLLERF